MRYVVLASLLVLSLITSPAVAARHPRYRGNGVARAATAQREAAFLRQFDANGDGQLDASERQAALEALKQMQNSGATGGKVAGGLKKTANKLNQAQKQELIKRFDKDGDGKLDAAEREAARKDLEKLAAHK